jgi:ribosome-associated protein
VRAKAPAATPKTALGPRTKKARVQPAATTPSVSIASDDARGLAVLIAIAALDKKAVGLEILDVAGKVDYADFLVLMTGRSDRQVAALAEGIEDALRKKNRRPLSVEGTQEATWILMDYGDVVVHVFQDDARSLYDIEGLWLDVRRLPVPMPEGSRVGPPSISDN